MKIKCQSSWREFIDFWREKFAFRNGSVYARDTNNDYDYPSGWATALGSENFDIIIIIMVVTANSIHGNLLLEIRLKITSESHSDIFNRIVFKAHVEKKNCLNFEWSFFFFFF